MARILLIVALLAAVFWVYSIVDCALQPATRHRGVKKPMWIVIVIVIPVLGGVLWFTVGRSRASRAGTVRAPDDDLEFLGRLGSISDQDERIRRMEEELAALDAEADEPAPPASAAADADAPESESESESDTSSDSDGDDPRGHRGAVG